MSSASSVSAVDAAGGLGFEGFTAAVLLGGDFACVDAAFVPLLSAGEVAGAAAGGLAEAVLAGGCVLVVADVDGLGTAGLGTGVFDAFVFVAGLLFEAEVSAEGEDDGEGFVDPVFESSVCVAAGFFELPFSQAIPPFRMRK